MYFCTFPPSCKREFTNSKKFLQTVMKSGIVDIVIINCFVVDKTILDVTIDDGVVTMSDVRSCDIIVSSLILDERASFLKEEED